MGQVKRALRWLDEYAESSVMVLILGIASILIFAQVIARYCFQSSFSWSEESARYMFIWMIYLGISYAVKKDRHIRVDAILVCNIFSEFWKKIICLFADIVFLGFAITVSYIGFKVMFMVARRGQITASTEIPMWFVYLAVPLGYALCSIRLIQRLTYCIKNFNQKLSVFNRQELPESFQVFNEHEKYPEIDLEQEKGEKR